MAALDPLKVVGGTSNSLRFHPDLFSNAAQVKKFEDLLAAYFFDLGGQQLADQCGQLRDAQRRPATAGEIRRSSGPDLGIQRPFCRPEPGHSG